MSRGMSRAETSIACPFYRGVKKGEKKVLLCDSPLVGALENETRFGSEGARKEYEREFCRSGRYPLCKICQANDGAAGFKRPEVDEEGRRV